MTVLQLNINENLYIRDPQETELGRNIIQYGIKLIDEMGLEKFTFKKLAAEIDSTEASIYRYFENKHRMLVYLIAWYWNWLEYKIDYSTHNIEDPLKRLDIALRIIAEKKERDPHFANIDESALYRIVIAESDKTYLTKQVDADNKEGLFRGFKSLCKKVADIVKEINPSFHFAHALISTVLQTAHQQIFFAQHLPSLTELKYGSVDFHEQNYLFIKTMVTNTIHPK